MTRIADKPSFIEDFAAALGRWIPMLGGRTFAVSEIDPITKDNMPTLPVGIVSLARQTYESFPTITTTFVVELVLSPERATDSGCETPFWAYYDFDTVRDLIFVNLPEIEDQYGTITPVSMDVEADKMAVHISMQFTRTSRWCEPTLDSGCEPDMGASKGVIFTVKSGPMEPPCTPHEPDCKCAVCWMDEEQEAVNG